MPSRTRLMSRRSTLWRGNETETADRRVAKARDRSDETGDDEGDRPRATASGTVPPLQAAGTSSTHFGRRRCTSQKAVGSEMRPRAPKIAAS